MGDTQKSLSDLVDDLSSIKKEAFQIVVGISFSIAILSVCARAVIRLKTRRHLSLDDYLLFFAAACLTGATGFVYYLCDNFYLSTAIQLDQTIVSRLNSQQLLDIINNAVQENASFLIIAWTATFFVKFSFLAFFKQLIQQVDKIQYYYWSVVAITIVSWMFLVSEPFILCSDFGVASLSCFDHSKDILYISMTGLITGLDALTDIMIASIPIIVLHRVRIRTIQKVNLGAFLCLSLVMVCFAITRASKIHGAAGVDVPSEFFWQFMEASVAVTMGSLTVARTLLAAQTKNGDEHRKRAEAAAGFKPHAIFSYRMRLLRKNRGHTDLESQDDLPEVPSATMTGLRTFIRRNNRNSGLDTQVPPTAVSQQETLGDDDDARRLITQASHKSGSLQEVIHPHAQEQWQRDVRCHYPRSLTGCGQPLATTPQDPAQTEPSSQMSCGSTTLHE